MGLNRMSMLHACSIEEVFWNLKSACSVVFIQVRVTNLQQSSNNSHAGKQQIQGSQLGLMSNFRLATGTKCRKCLQRENPDKCFQGKENIPEDSDIEQAIEYHRIHLFTHFINPLKNAIS